MCPFDLDMARRGDVGEWSGLAIEKMNNSKIWGICSHNWKEFLGTKVRLGKSLNTAVQKCCESLRKFGASDGQGAENLFRGGGHRRAKVSYCACSK